MGWGDRKERSAKIELIRQARIARMDFYLWLLCIFWRACFVRAFSAFAWVLCVSVYLRFSLRFA